MGIDPGDQNEIGHACTLCESAIAAVITLDDAQPVRHILVGVSRFLAS